MQDKLGLFLVVTLLTNLMLIPAFAMRQEVLDEWVAKLDAWMNSDQISPLEAVGALAYLVKQGYVTKEQNFKAAEKVNFIKHSADAAIRFAESHPEMSKGKSAVDTQSYLFTIKVLKCDVAPGGKYLTVGGKITNNDSISHTPELVFKGVDTKGEIVTFELGYADEIAPGQTLFVDRMIHNDPAIDSCGIEVNQAN